MIKYNTNNNNNMFLEPPVNTPGYWILRNAFNGIKSFGVFVCENKKCNNRWTSAYANKEFRQGCKLCDKRVLPSYMWVNANKQDKDKDTDKQDKDKDTYKPHDSKRCEACEKGVCIRSVVIMIESEPEQNPIQIDDLEIRRNLLREKIKKSFL